MGQGDEPGSLRPSLSSAPDGSRIWFGQFSIAAVTEWLGSFRSSTGIDESVARLNFATIGSFKLSLSLGRSDTWWGTTAPVPLSPFQASCATDSQIVSFGRTPRHAALTHTRAFHEVAGTTKVLTWGAKPPIHRSAARMEERRRLLQGWVIPAESARSVLPAHDSRSGEKGVRGGSKTIRQ